MSSPSVQSARRVVTNAHGGVIVGLIMAFACVLLASAQYEVLAMVGVALCGLLLGITRALTRVLAAVEEVSLNDGREA